LDGDTDFVNQTGLEQGVRQLTATYVFRPMSTVSMPAQYAVVRRSTAGLQLSQSTVPSSRAMYPSRLHAAP
jgi:hypothetical protein